MFILTNKPGIIKSEDLGLIDCVKTYPLFGCRSTFVAFLERLANIGGATDFGDSPAHRCNGQEQNYLQSWTHFLMIQISCAFISYNEENWFHSMFNYLHRCRATMKSLQASCLTLSKHTASPLIRAMSYGLYNRRRNVINTTINT